MRTNRKRIVVSLFAATGLLTLLAPQASVARDMGKLDISPEIGVVTKSYPAIAAAKPATAATPFAQVKACRGTNGASNQTYCDNIDWVITPPPSYKPIYSVRLTLAWVPGVASNNMTLWVFADSPEANGALGPAVVSDTAGSTRQPRVVEVGEPGKTTLYVSVVNQNPGNTGYTLKAEWLLTDLGPNYVGPKVEEIPTFAPIEAKKAPSAPINPAFDFTEEEETIIVKVPGPDGELVDREIPLVRAAGVTAKAGKASPIVPAIVGLFGLGAGFFLYFFVWRRRRQEERA